VSDTEECSHERGKSDETGEPEQCEARPPWLRSIERAKAAKNKQSIASRGAQENGRDQGLDEASHDG
jgi:hypothetical protein